MKHGHTRHMRWTTANGSIPSTRCERCQRPTPILIHGLGFDCCADASAPAETIQPVEHPFRRAVSPWIYCPAWAALIAILTVIGVHKL